MVLDLLGGAEHDGALSELTGEVSIGVLLVFLVCCRWGRYIVLDLQGDISFLHTVFLFYKMILAIRNTILRITPSVLQITFLSPIHMTHHCGA